MVPDTQATSDSERGDSISFMQRRSRCYALSTAISATVTAVAAYESYTHFESSNPIEVCIAGGAGLAAIVGSITMLGCAQSAYDSYRWNQQMEGKRE